VAAARKKKPFSFDEHWGQQIFRTKKGPKEFLWALVRRKYDEDDIERKGIGIHIGVEEKPIFEMETDQDPESVTFGKRVPKRRIVYDTAGNPKEEDMPVETRFTYIHEVSPVNIKKYKKLEGHNTLYGYTQFYWVINDRKVKCDNPEDFWKYNIGEVQKYVIPEKVSIVPTSAK